MGADPSGFKQYPPRTSGTQSFSMSSISQSLSQTNPPFPAPPSSYWRLSTHGPDLQLSPVQADQPVPPERRTSSSTFPIHSQSSSGSHTPFGNVPARYVMSTHPQLLNQPLQPHVYHAYRPIDATAYSAARYFPFLGPQPQPQLFPPLPSYEQARLPPPSLPQFASNGPGSPHVGPYGSTQQYLPHPYNAVGPFRPSQPYQQYQWYHGLGPPTDVFVDGNMQVQHHSPIQYPYLPSQHPPRASSVQMAQSTGSESFPLHGLAPSSSSASVTASRSTVSPPAGDPSCVPVQSLLKTSTHQPSQKMAATTRARDPPTIRRQYHPNPPPNRSQWVMWIGNVPRDATSDELWQFLSQPSTLSSGSEGGSGVEDNGVISIFLIFRSNCAFANYQSEAQLNRAISQFSGRKLRPHDRRCPRLVCRARRIEDELRAGVGGQRGRGIHTNYVKSILEKGGKSLTAIEGTMGHRSGSSQTCHSLPAPPDGANNGPTQSPVSHASTSSSLLGRHFPKRFFILKSLSQNDLDLSTERGIWATQKHNEAILDQAFRTSNEVILVFSVNKSGEFYGYARMASRIFSGDHDVLWAPRTEPSTNRTSPLSSRMPTRSSTEPSEYFPRQTHTPSEGSSVEVSPSPFATSSESKGGQSMASSSEFDSSQRQSLEPCSPDRDSEGSGTSDPPPQSRSVSGRQIWSQVLDPPSDPPPTPTSTSWNAGVLAETGDCDTEDSSSRGLRSLPVMEDLAPVKDDPPQTGTPPPGNLGSQEADSGWGDAFKVEWLSTEPVRFNRTRHLRNPWNHGREIKVSRDGTELEPVVGQKLVDSWPTLANSSTSCDDVKRSAVSRLDPSAQVKGVRKS